MSKVSVCTLHSLMNDFIEFKSYDPSCGEGRLRTLKQLQTSFKNCISDELTPEDFGSRQMMQFETYLKAKHSGGTVRKRLMDLKGFFNYLNFEEGYTTNSAVKRYRVPKHETDFVILDDKKIAILTAFKEPEKLTKVKDITMILLLTGMAIGDYNELRPIHIKDGSIKKRRKKTKTLFTVPLHSTVIDILEKYGIENIPKMTNQTYNRQVQKLFMLIDGFDVETELQVDDKFISKPFFKWYSSHNNRHSFIDRGLRKQIPINVLMTWVGHKTIQQLVDYSKRINGEDTTHYINLF